MISSKYDNANTPCNSEQKKICWIWNFWGWGVVLIWTLSINKSRLSVTITGYKRLLFLSLRLTTIWKEFTNFLYIIYLTSFFGSRQISPFRKIVSFCKGLLFLACVFYTYIHNHLTFVLIQMNFLLFPKCQQNAPYIMIDSSFKLIC